MVPGLDLRLVHGVGHELLEDVGLVVLEAPRAHAVDDDVVVRVVDVLAGVVLGGGNGRDTLSMTNMGQRMLIFFVPLYCLALTVRFLPTYPETDSWQTSSIGNREICPTLRKRNRNKGAKRALMKLANSFPSLRKTRALSTGR